jgi:CheY-like chemotaxis protein
VDHLIRFPDNTAPARTILLVEDEAQSRVVLTQLLEGQGYDVRCASSAAEALEYLQKNTPPGVIVLDLAVSGMDGAAFRARQTQDPALAHIPLIVLSDLKASGQQAPLAGDVFYLQKPVVGDDLFVTVARCAASAGMEVLVVENEEAVRKMLEMALRQSGFRVREAKGGAEAVQLYDQHHDTIWAVLLDVQMPGMDGVETLAALRQIDPQVRVVFMSGSTGEYSTADLLSAGAFSVLAKPFRSLAHLITTLHRSVRSSV